MCLFHILMIYFGIFRLKMSVFCYICENNSTTISCYAFRCIDILNSLYISCFLLPWYGIYILVWIITNNVEMNRKNNYETKHMSFVIMVDDHRVNVILLYLKVKRFKVVFLFVIWNDIYNDWILNLFGNNKKSTIKKIILE